MITFENIGHFGRLCNQLFQYASLAGIAYNRGFDYVIPDHSQYVDEGRANSIYHQLQHCFTMEHLGNRYGIVDGDTVYIHQAHEFCEDLFNQCPDNVTLYGYFQTEKYFKHIEDKIRQDFTFQPHIVKAVEQKYGDMIFDCPVSIVVRHFNSSFDSPGIEHNHRNLPWEYYEQGIRLFGKNRKYIICSNNIEFCKQQPVFQGDNFIFNDDRDDSISPGHFDLCLISLCSDFIMGNSSFSWWGTWLSAHKDKRVLAPFPWYGPGLSHLATEDLYPDDWIKIRK